MKTIHTFHSLISVPLFAALFACSSDATTNTADGGVTSDGGAATNDDSGASGATDSGTGQDVCSNATAPLPVTQVTVDGVTYYLTLKSVLPSTTTSNTQINFGTEAQFRSCVDEPGKNSTFAVSLIFKQKPTASGTFTFTDVVPPPDGQMRINVNFFTGKGHARDKKNYATGTTGSLAVVVAGGKLQANLSNIEVVNLSDANDKLTFSGTIDVDW